MMQLSAFLFCLLALAGLAYQAGCLVALRRVLGRGETGPADAPMPAIALLRPLHGNEPDLCETLRSGITQDYPGRVTHVFGVADAGDPAIRVVERLARDHPEAEIVPVVEPRLHGANRKVSNLINMLGKVESEILVFADSDIRVAPDYLRRLAAALAVPGTGAVSCLYRGRAVVAGPWARLSALAIDAHFLQNSAFGIAFGLAEPCFGSTIALKRETLARAGGLAAIADQLADDYALGRAVRSLGLRVDFAPFLVDHNCVHSRPGELLAHDLRWARTIRALDPAGHAGTLLTFAVPHALFAIIASGGAWPFLGFAAGIIAARLGLFRLAADRHGLPCDRIWLLPIRDVLSYGTVLASLFGRHVAWRGARFEVASSGAMTAIDPAPKQTMTNAVSGPRTQKDAAIPD